MSPKSPANHRNGPNGVHVRDVRPDRERMRAEVLQGLRKPQKELPSKYLYDERGSQLFERIWTDEREWFAIFYLTTRA